MTIFSAFESISKVRKLIGAKCKSDKINKVIKQILLAIRVLDGLKSSDTAKHVAKLLNLL